MYQKYNIGEKSVKFYQKLKNAPLNISELEKLNMYLKSGHPDSKRGRAMMVLSLFLPPNNLLHYPSQPPQRGGAPNGS